MRVRSLLVGAAVVGSVAAGGSASAAPIADPVPGCIGQYIRADLASGSTPAELGEREVDGVFGYIYSARSVCPHVIPPKSRHS